MKIVIFGIGQLYRDNKSKIPCTDEVIAFLDNNACQWGKTVDHVEVYSPESIGVLVYDKIVLMSVYAVQMRQQLLALGCKKKDILRYDEYFANNIKKNPRFFSYDSRMDSSKRKLLIITNELGYHGGAMAAVYAAVAMKQRNYEVIIAAAKADRGFIDEMLQKGISFAVCEFLEYAAWHEMKWIQGYDRVIVSTLPMIRCAIEVAKHRHVIFWVHESQIIYSLMEYWIEEIAENIRLSNLQICAVSRIAKENFIRNLGEHEIKILRYGIPDLSEHNCGCREKRDIITFAMIGSIHPIKGQDIFIKSIRNLGSESTKCEFLIIGDITHREYGESINQEISSIPQLTVSHGVNREEIKDIYAKADVLVVPSRQETMSLIATEGMMYGKTCIVSSVAGMADFICDGENGFVFDINNVQELTEKMHRCIENRAELDEIGRNARKTYEDFFSIRSLGEQLSKLLSIRISN